MIPVYDGDQGWAIGHTSPRRASVTMTLGG